MTSASKSRNKFTDILKNSQHFRKIFRYKPKSRDGPDLEFAGFQAPVKAGYRIQEFFVNF